MPKFGLECHEFTVTASLSGNFGTRWVHC